MKRVNQTVIAAAGLVALAGTAMAQTITATGGNAQFSYGAGAVATSPTVASGTTVGNANLDINGAAAGGDQVFQTWWHYRVGADTREFSYHAAANPFVAAGNTMTGTFNLPSAAPVFSSTLRYVMEDPDGAGVSTSLLKQFNTVTNTSGAPQTLNIFSYADFDPNGSLSHPYSYDVGQQALSGNSGGVTFFYKGFGATAYQATDYSLLRTALHDTAVTNLNNSIDGVVGVGPGSGDFTGGFQWTLALAPGQSVELLAVLSVNTPPVPAPGMAAVLGLAGLAGIRRRR